MTDAAAANPQDAKNKKSDGEGATLGCMGRTCQAAAWICSLCTFAWCCDT